MSEYERACDANDLYRQAVINRKYYGARLDAVQRRNKWVEIAIAVGTSASVASLAFWHTDGGKIAFGLIGGLSAILSVAKPIWNLSGDIARYSKMWTAYNSVGMQMAGVSRDMIFHRRIRPEIIGHIDAARTAMSAMANFEDSAPDMALLNRCQDEVELEFPIDRLYWPNEEAAAA